MIRLQLPTVLLFIAFCSCMEKRHAQDPVAKTLPATAGTVLPISKSTTGNVAAAPVQKQPPGLTRYDRPELINAIFQPAAGSIAEELELLERRPEVFQLLPAADTAIICREGTRIKIKANSFLLSSSKKTATAPVMFEVKEYYQLSDMLTARLSARSNGNILETGGMLFLKAVSEGKTCMVNENAPLEISFPFKERKDSMLLFTANNTGANMNWERMVTASNPLPKTDEPATFPGGFMGLKSFLDEYLVYPAALQETGGTIVVGLQFTIDQAGKAIVSKFSGSLAKEFEREINRVCNKMPLWKPAKAGGVPVASSVSYQIAFVSLADERDTAGAAFRARFENNATDTLISEARAADIRYYVFSTSTLGWINCDRFYNSPKPVANFYVHCGDHSELEVQLVFHSFKGILNSEGTAALRRFTNIPRDEAVTIVAVKKKRNETFISITPSNTSLGTVNDLAFEKVTKDTLKKKLEQLSKLW